MTTPKLLHTEIGQTRAALGDTVEALAAKTDVKARAARATGVATQRIADTSRRPDVRRALVVFAVAALIIGAAVVAKRR